MTWEVKTLEVFANKSEKKTNFSVSPIITLMFCLHFLTITTSAWDPFHRKALVCVKMLFVSLCEMLMLNTNLFPLSLPSPRCHCCLPVLL